jgi:hypothetical protein
LIGEADDNRLLSGSGGGGGGVGVVTDHCQVSARNFKVTPL